MIVERRNFPHIIPDNEDVYFSSLIGMVGSIDIDASILITRKIDAFNFRIVPSSSSYINNIIRGINEVNNTFGLRALFSKSIKTLYSINFDIEVK